jgi:hypothetical protein
MTMTDRQPQSREDIVSALGDVSDATVTALLALSPSWQELEEVALRIEGADLRTSASTNVAQMVDIVKTDERYLDSEER